MEFIEKENIKTLSNPGVVSRQILNPEKFKKRASDDYGSSP